MKYWLPLLLWLSITGCSVDTQSESGQQPNLKPWVALETVDFDAQDAQTSLVELPATDERQALRISSETGACFQVTTAINAIGEEQANPFISELCPDCLWRTSVVDESGLLVLEGRAKRLHFIGFGRVDCENFSVLPTEGFVNVETLTSFAPSSPGIHLRLVLSQTIDVNLLVELVTNELGIQVDIAAIEVIQQSDILLQGATDILPLQAILDELPIRDEGIIDVVIGPCLQREDAFGTQRVAGLTPRIPGGAGPADAVFIARRSCGFRDQTPDNVNEIARLVAHELGHYLGLAHPEELDGTLDDLASTDSSNLMHREPLRADATGLSDEQRARMLAHPFVQNF